MMTQEEFSLSALLVTIERFVKPYIYLHCHSLLLYSLDLGTPRMCDNMVIYLHTGDEQRNKNRDGRYSEVRGMFSHCVTM